MVAEQCVDRYRGEGAAKEIADCSSAVASLTCEQLTSPLYGSEYDTLQLLWSRVHQGAHGTVVAPGATHARPRFAVGVTILGPT